MISSYFTPRTHALRDFEDGCLIDPGDPRRAETEAFIAHVYRARYGAELRQFLPHLLAFRNGAEVLHAAVGLRCGNEGPLFVERYLDTSAERAIADIVGAEVPRSRLVEVGNFAALSAGDSRAVILALTHRLHAAGFHWVLFAATRQLRNAFDRLHLGTIELGEATAARAADDGNDWGRYYQSQPRLMFGDLVAGHAYLAGAQPVRRADPTDRLPMPCLAGGL